MRSNQDKRVIEYVATGELTPYARNSRTHSPQQVKQIAASIKEFGFTNPVLIDADNGIIAGHGRVMAAEHMKLTEVPCIRLGYLTETQKRAYVIADNKLALNAAWDEEMLKLELDELHALDFNMELIGFDGDELVETMALDVDERYTRKVEAPIYEPTGNNPAWSNVFNDARCRQLLAEIEACTELTGEERAMLVCAAYRHVVIDYRNVAEKYARATPNVQQLYQNSALVIIDFNAAIEQGFVKLNDELQRVYAEEYGDD